MDKQFFLDLAGNAAGLAEQAVPMVTGSIAEPVAGLAALYHAGDGGDDASGVVNAIREAMTYQPRTEAGKMYQQALSGAVERIVQSAPVRTWKHGVDIAGGYSPTAGAVLATVPTAIGVVAGAKPALRAGRATSNALNKVGQFAPTKNGAAALWRQKGMIDIWSDLLDADKKGGREAAKQRAIQLIQENPELETDVISNYQDLGYSDFARKPELIMPKVENGNAALKAEAPGESLKTEAQQILDSIRSHYDSSRKHQYYAYRVIPDDHNYQPGDYLPDSFRWEDGVNTGESLQGTSGIGIDIDSPEKGIETALKQRKIYIGKRHAIIASDKSPITGDDYGEWVLPDAKIVSIINHE